MCACSTNEIEFRSFFRTILARGTRSRVPRCIPSGAWRGSPGKPFSSAMQPFRRLTTRQGVGPRHPPVRAFEPRHPDPFRATKGAVRAPCGTHRPKSLRALWKPRPTLRGLDARQPHRGWIATGEISVLPRFPTSWAELRCSPLQPPSGRGASPLCNPGPPTHTFSKPHNRQPLGASRSQHAWICTRSVLVCCTDVV